jgi:hypothetical protein
MWKLNRRGVMNSEWLVDQAGQCLPLQPKVVSPSDRPYRLYRFLADVEDILSAIADPVQQCSKFVPWRSNC